MKRTVFYGLTMRRARNRAVEYGINPDERSITYVCDANRDTVLNGYRWDDLIFPDGNGYQIASMTRREAAREAWLQRESERRRVVTGEEIQRMMPDVRDGLPSPAEVNGRRKLWVGMGWIDQGEADGSEPLLIIDAVTVGHRS